MHYRLQFPSTVEDSYQFMLHGLLYTEWGKKHIRKERLKAAIAWAIWTMIGLLYYKLSTTFYMVLVLFLTLEIFWQLFMVKIILSNTKRNCKRRYKQEIQDGITETIMEFHEDRFVDISGPIKTEIEYASVDRLVLYKDTYLFIYTTARTGNPIPRTAFADDAQVAAFVAFLQDRGIQVETVSK